MTTSDGSDRRKGVRVRFDTGVSLTLESGSKVISAAGDIRDISLNGIFVRTPEKVESGAGCDIRIELTGTEVPIVLEMKGKVVRIEGNGVGVHFDAMDLDTFMHLKNVVRYNAPESDIF